jgi:GT2 family glycosyltransferase
MTHLARAVFIRTGVTDSGSSGCRTREVGVLAGSFWIARREAVEKVGLLDESFFFYGEDHDWCERFRAAGWKICYYPAAESIHFGGASSAVDPFRFNTEIQKAILRHWEKYHSRVSTLAYLLIGMLYHGLRLALRSLRLALPAGDRALARAKWRQHWASLLWLSRAAMDRAFPRGSAPQHRDPCSAVTKL